MKQYIIFERGNLNSLFLVLLMVSSFGGVFCFSAMKVMGMPQEKYAKKLAVAIEHGKTQNSVGFFVAAEGVEQPSSGPESFFADSLGNTYICDTVNQRIQVFAATGNHQLTIDLPTGTVASDAIADKQGDIYVYDDLQGSLLKYNHGGHLQSSIPVDYRRWQSRGPMYIAQENIYMSSGDQESHLIAKIQGGQLEPPTQAELAKPAVRGIYGFSGNRYYTKKTGQHTGQIEVIDNADVTVRTIEVNVPNLASITFLQEDKKQHLYIQVERFEPPNKIFLEVHKLDADGTLLSLIPIPENNYEAWSVKLLEVNENGAIHQLLPAKERSQLNIFTPEE